MTRQELIPLLKSEIETREVDNFLKLLSVSIKTENAVLNKHIQYLHDERERNLEALDAGVFDDFQARASYSSVVDRFFIVLEKELKDCDIVQANKKVKKDAVSTNSETKEKEDYSTKRPLVISVWSVLVFLGIINSLGDLINNFEVYENVGGLFLVYTFISFILSIIANIGLWLMKKWNLTFAITNFALGLIVMPFFIGKLEFTYEVSIVTYLYLLLSGVLGMIAYTLLNVFYRKRMT